MKQSLRRLQQGLRSRPRGLKNLVLVLVFSLSFPAIAAAGPVTSETMLAAVFDFIDSPVFVVDTATGGSAFLGFTGFRRLNSLARTSSGAYYAYSAPSFQATSGTLISIDPLTGQGSMVADFFVGDVRALAIASDDTVFAIEDGEDPNSPDDLIILDPGSEDVILVGSTGTPTIQGMAFSPQGDLYAWSLPEGLGILDQATGLFVDIDPAVSAADTLFQTLSFLPDGGLLGIGQGELFEIDPATGEIFFRGFSDVDIRGAEPNLSFGPFMFLDGFESGDTARWGLKFP